MVRRSSAETGDDAVDALVSALRLLGLEANCDRQRADERVLDVAGEQFRVVTKTVVTDADARRMSAGRRAAASVIVADRISEEAKMTLRRSGSNFYDRRGELRIVRPPLILDTTLPSTTSTQLSARRALESQVAKEVAIACLLRPAERHGVRDTASYIQRAPSAVSHAMGLLRAEGLLTSLGEPLVPDLFHELVMVWRRKSVALASLPNRDRTGVSSLELGFDGPEGSSGWALTDTRAAVVWGMPVVASGEYPPDFYVPSQAVARRAVLLLGEAARPDARACTIAVAPVRLVCLRRLAGPSSRAAGSWAVANHIVVALDLAQDRSRGVEILEQWRPDGMTRAW